MDGQQLWDYLFNNLVNGQVLYMSRNESCYTFLGFVDNERLQFSIPNRQGLGNINRKTIPSSALIRARNFYLENHLHMNLNEWLLLNDINWHNDCRINVLNCLIKIPEYLRNQM